MEPEVRAKISATLTGRKQSAGSIELRASMLRGRKYAPDHCAKISAGKMGRKASLETIAKLIASHKGVPLSAERRAACSKRLKEMNHKGESHPMSKLKEGDIRAIRASLESNAEMAKKFQINPSTVSQIRSRKRWGHISD
jgi:hypothetical protein